MNRSRCRRAGRGAWARWGLAAAVALLWGLGGWPLPAPPELRGAEYPRINGPCNQEFPRDHGPHQDFKTEWWYYTGNLESAEGRRFGFQITFFRSRMSPEQIQPDPSEPLSGWRTQQIYLAHAALSDLTKGAFHQDERMARGALDLAGARLDDDTTRVFLADWELNLGPEHHRVRATASDFALELTLLPEKPPVRHGRAGTSQKGERPESASCYYSFTRLRASGRVSEGGVTREVGGSAWMDHEYSSAPLEPDLVGWDWFSLQLSDRGEVMIYLLRNREGAYTAASAGTLVAPSGQVTGLTRGEIEIETRGTWQSPRTGGRYPARWRITLPGQGLDLLVTPNLADQEMVNEESGLPAYWEGSVNIVGTRRGRELTGLGYVELTGYARAFDAPL